MKKILFVLAVLAVVGYFYRQSGIQESFKLMTGSEPVMVKDIEVVAENLNTPWEVVFLPTGEMLITERPGTLLKIGKDRQKISIAGVEHIGEGGLLGVELDSDYVTNSFVYLYLTTKNGDRITNRVEKYKFEGDRLTNREVIVEGILGSSIHDGGRIKFGPDGYLYITTGDAGQELLAQNKESLNGKILRYKNGEVEMFSYGHRNPQGLAWDNLGNLWATEHGRSGVLSGLDELNLIEEGNNYGWPVIEGDEVREGMETPVKQSGTTTTWAPAGLAYYKGDLFFAGLRGEALYKYNIESGELTKHLFQVFGRLRAVVIGPDNYLYISTSNTDGRGDPNSGDDKIIKINPKVL